MTDTELAQHTLLHFGNSCWNLGYALAPVSEKWYTAEMAAGLMLQERYPYPTYRFFGEESYASIAKTVEAPCPLLAEDQQRIPDLTLIDTDTRRLIFVVEAKVVTSERPNNLSYDDGNLGDQMRRAARCSRQATVYGMVIVVACHNAEEMAIPALLAGQIMEYAATCHDQQLREYIEELATPWLGADNRKTPRTLESDFEEWRTKRGGALASHICALELLINEAKGRLSEVRDTSDGIAMGPTRGLNMAGMMTNVQLICEKTWANHGTWTTKGIEEVPTKGRMVNIKKPGPKGVCGLGIGLWRYDG